MKIFVPREQGNERRVAITPQSVPKLIKAGFEVLIEKGAGEGSFFGDSLYEKAGATLVTEWHDADIVLKVSSLKERNGKREEDFLKSGSIVIAMLNPLGDPALIDSLAKKNVTAFAMELVPRISRAQSMDALSSQASVGGYKAVLLAANKLGKFFPMLTTAAGTITPAKVLIIGVGVAGLQAIATARRLGAVVEAFDIRPSSKQEVESLGAKFIEIKLGDTQDKGGYAKEVSEDAKKKEHEVLSQHVRQSDIVITAAQVPGRRAPVLVTEDMMVGMKEGSVILDMAAEQGGNCALTQAGKDIVHNGVTIMGPVNLPSMMPYHASEMYSKNITTLLLSMVKEGKLIIDLGDEVIKGSLVAKDGQITNEKVKGAIK